MRYSKLLASVFATSLLVMAQQPKRHPEAARWRSAGRDPFAPIQPPKSTLPSGRAGLLLSDLHIIGVAVGGPLGPVALVSDSAAGIGASQIYFLRPGDRIYDALILRISPQGVWCLPTSNRNSKAPRAHSPVLLKVSGAAQ